MKLFVTSLGCMHDNLMWIDRNPDVSIDPDTGRTFRLIDDAYIIYKGTPSYMLIEPSVPHGDIGRVVAVVKRGSRIRFERRVVDKITEFPFTFTRVLTFGRLLTGGLAGNTVAISHGLKIASELK